MAYEVLMPQLGLTMEEGTVERWLKAEGDPVKAGEPLLEITTDKLTNEVAAETDGVLLKIVAQEGADVPVKGLLGYIGQPGEQVGDGAAAPAAGRRSVHPAAAASSCCWSLLHSLRSVRRSHPPEKPRMPPCLQYRQWYWPRAALHAVLQAAHQSRQCTAALR